MMRTSLSTLAAALMLAAAPAALAQTGSSSDAGMVGGLNLEAEVEQNIRERMGPEQRELELVQTTLLNRFGGLGFHRIVDIDKQGPSYIATVENVAGETVVVEVDMDTGQIVSEGLVRPEEIAGAAGTTAPAAPAAGAMQPVQPDAGPIGIAPGTAGTVEPGASMRQPARPPGSSVVQ